MNDEDARHLDLLATFHYVVAGIVAVFGCLPILHVAMGIAVVNGAFNDGKGNPPPDFFGYFFIVGGLLAILFLWSLAIAAFIAGRKLRQRTGYLYCLVVAAFECMFMPIGTVLGIFTILVLSRPSVKTLFGQPISSSASS